VHVLRLTLSEGNKAFSTHAFHQHTRRYDKNEARQARGMLLRFATLLATGRVAVGFNPGTRLARPLRVRVERSSPLDFSSAQFLPCAPPTDYLTAGDLADSITLAALTLTSEKMGIWDTKWYVRAPIQALVHLALSAIRNGYVTGVRGPAGLGAPPPVNHNPPAYGSPGHGPFRTAAGALTGNPRLCMAALDMSGPMMEWRNNTLGLIVAGRGVARVAGCGRCVSLAHATQASDGRDGAARRRMQAGT
jgi:hypothetical protein